MNTKLAQFPSKVLSTDDRGIVECLVSAYGNVDRVGDRVVKGAFADSLKAWEARGDPVPFIWSHDWQNPEAHIGKAIEVEERDDGLYVKAELDLDQPFAAQVYRLLKQRRVTSFSFAYDVAEEKRHNGANELRKLNLLECGPTLVPANDAAVLLGVKEGRELSGATLRKLQAIHDAICEFGVKCAPASDAEDDPPAKAEEPVTVKAQERNDRTYAETIAIELMALEVA